MNTKTRKILKDFVGSSTGDESDVLDVQKKNQSKIVGPKTGLIERVDRVLLVEDGRQLLHG